MSRNTELLEFSVENVHLNIWNKQLHQSFAMSRVSLNNSIFIEFPVLDRQTAHFYGSWGGKSPSQGSVMGDKVSQWITQFHRAHSRRDANGMSLTEIEHRLTSHAGWHCFIYFAWLAKKVITTGREAIKTPTFSLYEKTARVCVSEMPQ